MRKLLSLLTALLLALPTFSALADSPVVDLRGRDAVVRFPDDAPILTVLFPQMFFADAAILLCDGHAALIDAGGYAQEASVQTALEALGITYLDWVVATHPHHDHQPGFEVLARRMGIGRFLTSFPENENTIMRRTMTVMLQQGVTVETATDGMTLSLGRASMTLLLPENTGKTINNRSLLALVTLGDSRLLMLADLETMGQQALLDSGADVSADILKYPHHGHAAMNETLLAAIAPKLAVITAKPIRAPYALSQLEKRGIPAAHTDEAAVWLQTDGQVWVVREGLPEP